MNIRGDLQEGSGVEMFLPSLFVLSEGQYVFLIRENCRMGSFLVCWFFYDRASIPLPKDIH